MLNHKTQIWVPVQYLVVLFFKLYKTFGVVSFAAASWFLHTTILEAISGDTVIQLDTGCSVFTVYSTQVQVHFKYGGCAACPDMTVLKEFRYPRDGFLIRLTCFSNCNSKRSSTWLMPM